MPVPRSRAETAGRLCALAAAVVVAAATAVPAGAQSGGDTYAAASRADGLLLSLGPERLSIGSATANADSTPTASATGTGFFTPEHQEAASSAEVTTDGQQDGSAEETCAQESPPEMPVVFAEGPCSSAVAAIQGGLPTATGTARGGTFSFGVSSIPGLSEPLGEAVDQIIDGLGPIFDGLEDGGAPNPETTLEELLGAVIDGSVATITSGRSAADVVETADGRVTATGSVDGTVIDLFETELTGPLVTVTIGSATATVTRTRATGQAVPAFTPAPVTISIAADAPLPPEFPREIVLPPGGSECIPLPDPLESCVTAGGGTTETTDEGVVTARASGARIDLLRGTPEGGIVIAASDAEAGIGGTVPTAPPPTTPPPTNPAQPELPRTGGPDPWVPATGWALLGVASLTGLAGLAARRAAVAGRRAQ